MALWEVPLLGPRVSERPEALVGWAPSLAEACLALAPAAAAAAWRVRQRPAPAPPPRAGNVKARMTKPAQTLAPAHSRELQG